MSEYPVPEDLKAECVLCKGRGRVSSTSFVRPGTYIERQCHNCKGRGWNWALTFDEMAERIARAEAQLAAANERAERLSRPVTDEEMAAFPWLAPKTNRARFDLILARRAERR